MQISSVSAQGLDERINEAFMPVAVWWENLILAEVPLFGHGIPIVLILLLSGALFFTLYFGFVNIRHFPTAIRVVRGTYDHLEADEPGRTADGDQKPEPLRDAPGEAELHKVGKDIKDTIKDESAQGEVNHFQALANGVLNVIYALTGKDLVRDPLGPAPYTSPDVTNLLLQLQRLHLPS